jgi:hypothetical protein
MVSWVGGRGIVDKNVNNDYRTPNIQCRSEIATVCGLAMTKNKNPAINGRAKHGVENPPINRGAKHFLRAQTRRGFGGKNQKT